MTTPSGWERIKPPMLEDVVMQWNHPYGEDPSLQLFIEETAEGYIIVLRDLVHRSQKTLTDYRNQPQTKKEARKIAVDWMREHEAPIVPPGGL